MEPYHTLYWDISGKCNAACKYCPSGSRNLLGSVHKSQAGFLSPKDFSNGLLYLNSIGVISNNPTRGTHVGLYSWGEPFLHPNFEEMMDIVSDLGFKYSLSTNASTPKEIPRLALLRLLEIKFSMPGFSQESYDRQHGFDFETICRNIIDIINSVRVFTPTVSFSLVFQMYETNKHEVFAAKAFADRLGIRFELIAAHLTGFAMPKNGYPKPNEFMEKIFEKTREMQPEKWQCPQYDILVLDEFSNVVLCCATERATPGYVIGNIKDVDFNNLREQRKRSPVCVECIQLGIGYLAHNVSVQSF
mgnify:CR=1 FL=1